MLTEKHLAEKRALESTHISNITNLNNAYIHLQADHQSQQNDYAAVVSERDELKRLNDQYLMNENPA